MLPHDRSNDECPSNRTDWAYRTSDCLAATAVEVYVRLPGAYVLRNLQHLLPSWTAPTIWNAIVLQQAELSLVQPTPQVNAEKDRLRERFLALGRSLSEGLRARRYGIEIVDPRTGYPHLGRRGDRRHDDVTAVATALNFEVDGDVCSYLVHPEWGAAVYPSVLFSAADSTILQPLFHAAARASGWVEADANELVLYTAPASRST
ncbi:hypothetical protein KR51_00006150 [Rubidibacter lacunae KORDI 51-2]|uniref:Methylmalonic aciduria and homocystinuria type D protein n=1 Tax=Rubidibacter lacunae KORDI 51-2 TaxID=582515 RepID=U5DSJ8_9CHRO|nr:methylmalonic aciduria and homocystinuria type D protein [Rubidibacter lacunae]ERN42660.1 hypothetical protein KR51_00006150 [Rubidibacter lacunae KORDI 51-2]